MDKKEFDEIKKKFEKETRQKKISKWLNYTSILFATLGIFIASNYFFKDFNNDFVDKASNAILKSQLSNIKNELSKSRKTIDSLLIINNSKIDSVQPNIALIELKKEVDNLNKIIMDNPEKAISIPLLKMEIENQKEQNGKELDSIKGDIARVYDMNKWIIGLVFTMLVSIIVLNISNLFAKNKKE